jgi:hypothetical protein
VKTRWKFIVPEKLPVGKVIGVLKFKTKIWLHMPVDHALPKVKF